MPSDQQQTRDSSSPTCPWCAYIGSLKQVLQHMTSAHPQAWADLALSPLVMGGATV
jgi:hypothetical protein